MLNLFIVQLLSFLSIIIVKPLNVAFLDTSCRPFDFLVGIVRYNVESEWDAIVWSISSSIWDLLLVE
jgi:hypothetical protein